MKIYLAARYSRNAEMRGIRDVLSTALGHTVTSRWIDLHPDMVGDFGTSFDHDALNSRPDECAPLGQHDLDDIDAADWVISFTCGSGGKGGRHVELGYALAKGKRLFVVGPRENVFHTLPAIDHHPTWRSLVIALSREAQRTISTVPNAGMTSHHVFSCPARQRDVPCICGSE